jgi:hypothetical protein
MGSVNLKVNEPSMEDILASIRRIIADDQEPVDEPETREASSPLKTVLDIAERHVSPGFYPEPLPVPGSGGEEEAPLVQIDPFQEERAIARLAESYETQQPVAPAVGIKAQTSQALAPQALTQPCERSPGEALMSRMTEATVAESFGRLGAARMPSPSLTVEDLMKEMLRPMLKAWLDENLPGLVERLVQAEIQRVARG